LFPGAVIRASALAVVSAAMLAGPLLACATAPPPRPVADAQAAPIVVVGILEEPSPNLVVDRHWPNSAAWAIDSHGRILDPTAPWSVASAPATLAAAREAMGIPPDTATAGESEAALPLVALLAVVAAVLAVLASYMGMNPRGRR
jgi:hypothetical protein